MTQTNTLSLVTKATHSMLKLAEEEFDVDLSSVAIRYDMTSVKVLGRAEWTTIGGVAVNMQLRFNPKAVLQNPQFYIDEVIPHEVAHLVCAQRRELGSNHDAGWKNIAVTLGCRHPGATLPMHLSGFNLRKGITETKYVYVDSTGAERMLTKGRHRNLQQGRTRGYVYNGGGEITKATFKCAVQVCDGEIVSKTGAQQATQQATQQANTDPNTNTATSKAERVRQHIIRIKEQGFKEQEVLGPMLNNIVNYVHTQFGFGTKAAARMCVTTNTPKIYSK